MCYHDRPSAAVTMAAPDYLSIIKTLLISTRGYTITTGDGWGTNLPDCNDVTTNLGGTVITDNSTYQGGTWYKQ